MPKIKVIYDARWLRTDGVFDGVSRYSHELGLALMQQANLEISWLICDEKQKKMLPPAHSNQTMPDYILENDPNDIMREISLPKRLNKFMPDVVYSPFFIMGFKGKKYKLVLTIHDMIYFFYKTPPHWLKPYVRVAWRLFHTSKYPMRALLNKADLIATVSDHAASQLKEYHMSKRPIIAVKNAVSDEFKPLESASDDHYKSNIILYMGAFTQYKNVELLLRALPDAPEVELHLLSKIPEVRRKALTKIISELKLTDRVKIHNGVSDEEYRLLLSRCRGLITASKLEGFGLPIIEAQRLGVPVACSDVPIFKEVAGNSALFFSPDSAKQCAKAMTSLADANVSHKLIEQGYENASRYTWQASAKQAASAIKRVLRK